MILGLSDEATEYGRVARQAFEVAGGDRLATEAERAPQRRAERVGPVLAELGAWDLAPRTNADELEAAAALCRSAGHWVVPYPVAERLARPLALEADGLVVIGDHDPVGAVAGIDLRWAAVTVAGRRSWADASPLTGPRPSGFASDLELRPIDDDGGDDVALGLVLPCWTLLGMLDRAIALTRAHVLGREQFGQPLASFQGVQFQLTEAEVERSGLEVLALHALWSIQVSHDHALDDALALRLAAIEAAEVVFRVAHQLHGAIGFCDEAPLSWLSRCSRPLRRLPFGRAATGDLLARRVDRRGLTGLFRDGHAAPA